MTARKFLRTLNLAFDAIEALPQPSVAAIEGPAVAGGLELALACTLRVASRNARLGLPEIKLGLVPAVGTSYRLPRAVGFGRAAELALLGDLIDANTAYQWGLVNRVTEPGEALSEALSLAQRLAGGPPVVISLFKEALLANACQGSCSARIVEILAASVNHSTHDKVEGIRAFLEKRQPRFEDL